ncbi:MAG: hypothetical protein HYY61_05405 [Deltaproteobacteria bacterium]|nr:hypothetical protein [Deltaproteobacteria bacterium]
MDQDQFDKSEKKMKRGQKLVISGFIVAVVGIVFYCIVSFVGSAKQEWTPFLFSHAHPILLTSLAIIGLGTLLWIIGSVMYLTGAMEKGPDEE